MQYIFTECSLPLPYPQNKCDILSHWLSNTSFDFLTFKTLTDWYFNLISVVNKMTEPHSITFTLLLGLLWWHKNKRVNIQVYFKYVYIWKMRGWIYKASDSHIFKFRDIFFSHPVLTVRIIENKINFHNSATHKIIFTAPPFWAASADYANLVFKLIATAEFWASHYE